MYQLLAAEGIPNGEVGVMDLGQLQKEKQDLEQQLLEKNKVRVLFTSAVSLPALSLYLCLKPFSPFVESCVDAPGHVSGRSYLFSRRSSSWISTCAAFLSHLPPLEIMSRGSERDFRCSQPSLLLPVGPVGPVTLPLTSFPWL